jgi:hypothetical protein
MLDLRIKNKREKNFEFKLNIICCGKNRQRNRIRTIWKLLKDRFLIYNLFSFQESILT